MQVTQIFSGNLVSSSVSVSNTFTNGQFLFFTIPTDSNAEGVEIGFVLSIAIPLGGGSIANKDVTLPSFEFVGKLTSFAAIEIPREYSESSFNCVCGFNSSINISGFTAYAVTSSDTVSSLATTLSNIQTQLTEIRADIAALSNDNSPIPKSLENITELILPILPRLLIGG